MLWTADKISHVVMWGVVCGMFSVLLKCLDITTFLSTFFTLWTVPAGSYLFISTLKIDVDRKFVLITGCDSGFGHALALHLNDMGFGVFACCLDANGDGAKRLQEKGSSKFHVLQMDITNKEQIKKTLTHVRQILGSEGTLWGIVNNAGISAFGAIEWVPTDIYKKIYDVNIHGTITVTQTFLPQRRAKQATGTLWGIVNNAGISAFGAIEWVPSDIYKKVYDVNIHGTITVTQTFLPLIRKAKGRVVTVSSIYGRINFPTGSVYAIEKRAIEGFNDCLRTEMKPFGVKVSLIEPGNFIAGTKIFTEDSVRSWCEKMWNMMDEEVKDAYGGQEAYNEVIKSAIKTSHTGDTNLGLVIDAMTEALVQQYPQTRYHPMSPSLYVLIFIYTHFLNSSLIVSLMDWHQIFVNLLY